MWFVLRVSFPTASAPSFIRCQSQNAAWCLTIRANASSQCTSLRLSEGARARLCCIGTLRSVSCTSTSAVPRWAPLPIWWPFPQRLGSADWTTHSWTSAAAKSSIISILCSAARGPSARFPVFAAFCRSTPLSLRSGSSSDHTVRSGCWWQSE